MSTTRKRRRVRTLRFVDDANVELQAKSGVPKYRMHAYSGGYLRVENFPGEKVVVDLESATWDSKLTPNYLRHKKEQPVGAATERDIAATHIEIEGELFEENEYRAEIVATHKQGKKWQGSIGARGFTIERVPDGERRTINQRVFVGPFIHARGARITEISFVDVGGDIDNHLSLAAKQQEGESEMSPAVKAFLESKGIDPVKATEEELTAAFATQGDSSPQVDAVDPAVSIDSANSQYAENETRVQGIRDLCATFGAPTIKDEDDETEVSLAAHAIKNKWDVDKVRLHAQLWDLDRKSPTDNVAPYGFVANRDLQSDQIQETLEASIATSWGVDDSVLKASYSEDALNRSTQKNYRSMTLRTLLASSLEANGVHASARMSMYDLWGAAHDMVLSASGTTVLSLPNLFENVLNKSLFYAFKLFSSTWDRIASVHSANDFRPLNFVRLTAEGGYRRVSADGEIKHMGMTDSKNTAQADTFGAIMTITRKMIKNDDMGGLQQRSMMIGEAAACRVEEEFYKVLLNLVNSGFVDAAKGNLLTGAGSSLDLGGLEAAEANFDERVNANGKPITTGASVLLHGTQLKQIARSLYNDMKFGTSDTTAGGKRKGEVIDNPFVNKYMPLMSGYINNGKITDSEGKAFANQSATKWWLAVVGSPAMSAIRAVFVDGVRTPYVETQEMAFEKLGLQVRSYHDFGFAEGDPEAILECAGA